MNDTLDAVYSDFSDWLSLIRYHSGSPDKTDPFYQANILENRARINYYSAEHPVRFLINGDDNPYIIPWRTELQDERNSKRACFTLALSGSYSARKGKIVAHITATGRIIDSNLRLRYAIVESALPYGGRVHNQVFRDMFPDTLGVPLTIAWGETVADSQDFAISGNWAEANCDIVAFIQSDNTKEVLQAERVRVVNLSVEEVDKPSSSAPLPGHYHLHQNYPNPFNSSTTIRFSIPRREHVTLKVFDVLGREVAMLVDGEINPGEHSVVYDTKGLASGVYFCRLTTPTFSQTKPMEVIK
jgi:hypothetical protein